MAMDSFPPISRDPLPQMSDEEFCIHDLDPSWCATCKHGPRKSEPEQAELRFTARYDGQCPSCNLPIQIGQRAVRTNKGRTLHESCLS